jgi:hypothetical protein
MNIPPTLENKFFKIVTKNEARFHFYTHFLSLTVNNASPFLRDDNCLGTLNYRELDASFLREPVRFSKLKILKKN